MLNQVSRRLNDYLSVVLSQEGELLKISTIIPAYNEETRIAKVLSVLQDVAYIDDIIVVSDGSSDRTVEVALQFKATVIALPQNIGKGGAMKAGIEYTDADTILFLDADLIGLDKDKHVMPLLRPIIDDEADMTVGIFGEGRMATDFAQKVAPSLSGQRAVKRLVFDDMGQLEASRFGVEVALNRFAEKSGIRVIEVPLPDLTHVMKEEKLGFVRGFWARMKMYWEIVRSTKYGRILKFKR